MSLLSSRTLVVLAACAFALAGCNADRPSSFAPSSSSGSDSPAVLAAAKHLNVAGQYAGRVDGGTLGSGHARGSISQYGNSLGGPISYTFSSGKRANATAATLRSDGSMQGTMVATVGSSACTFKFSANYDDANYKLTGSYHAVHGCSDEAGTFTLNEKCYYVLRADIRQNIGGLMPC